MANAHLENKNTPKDAHTRRGFEASTITNPHLHPQAGLAACCSPNNPILAPVKYCHRRNCRDWASELSELISISTIDVDKTVHIANAKALDMRLGVLLPAWTNADHKIFRQCQWEMTSTICELSYFPLKK
jgi:hypothetical protein